MTFKPLPHTIFALFLLAAGPAGATTLEALPGSAPVRVSGRVVSAASDPATRTTLVVLADGQGREVARFRTLGAVEGSVVPGPAPRSGLSVLSAASA